MLKRILLAIFLIAAPALATVTDTSEGRVTYTGVNGSQTVFPFIYPIRKSIEVVTTVTVSGSPVVITHFVTMNADQINNPGGTVTFTSAPAAGANVVVERDTPKTQLTSLNPFFPFPAKTVELSEDALELQIQEVDRRITDVLTALGSGGGSGGITNIGLTMPGIFGVANTPLLANGTFNVTLTSQNANLIFAGPSSGGASTPAFRSLVTADLPSVGGLSTGPTYGGGTVIPTWTIDSAGRFATLSASGTSLAGLNQANTFTAAQTIAPVSALGIGQALSLVAPAANVFNNADAALAATGGAASTTKIGAPAIRGTGGAGSTTEPAGNGAIFSAGAASTGGGASGVTATGSGSGTGVTANGGASGGGSFGILATGGGGAAGVKGIGGVGGAGGVIGIAAGNNSYGIHGESANAISCSALDGCGGAQFIGEGPFAVGMFAIGGSSDGVHPPGDGAVIIGGPADNSGDPAGIGIKVQGGNDDGNGGGGAAILATGGPDNGAGGGPAIIANGANENNNGSSSDGIDATGGSGINSSGNSGIHATGGSNTGASNGGPGGIFNGGNGINGGTPNVGLQVFGGSYSGSNATPGAMGMSISAGTSTGVAVAGTTAIQANGGSGQAGVTGTGGAGGSGVTSTGGNGSSMSSTGTGGAGANGGTFAGGTGGNSASGTAGAGGAGAKFTGGNAGTPVGSARPGAGLISNGGNVTGTTAGAQAGDGGDFTGGNQAAASSTAGYGINATGGNATNVSSGAGGAGGNFIGGSGLTAGGGQGIIATGNGGPGVQAIGGGDGIDAVAGSATSVAGKFGSTSATGNGGAISLITPVTPSHGQLIYNTASADPGSPNNGEVWWNSTGFMKIKNSVGNTHILMPLKAGTIALTSGTPSTATVSLGYTGFVCTCTETTTAANNLLKCSVASSTLTITGPNTVTDIIAYTCIQAQ